MPDGQQPWGISVSRGSTSTILVSDSPPGVHCLCWWLSGIGVQARVPLSRQLFRASVLLTPVSSGQVIPCVSTPWMKECFLLIQYLLRCFSIYICTYDVNSKLLCKPPTNHPGVKKPNHKDYKEK